jgi:hypothetical protein
LTFWFKEPEEDLSSKKPETPSPTTPSPKGEIPCENCGKITSKHSEEELKECTTQSINKSMREKYSV